MNMCFWACNHIPEKKKEKKKKKKNTAFSHTECPQSHPLESVHMLAYWIFSSSYYVKNNTYLNWTEFYYLIVL